MLLRQNAKRRRARRAARRAASRDALSAAIPARERWDEFVFGERILGDHLVEHLADYLTALFTFVLAAFAAFAWDDARQVAKDGQRQFELLQRPWVYVETAEVTSWEIKKASGGHNPVVKLGLRYTVTNTGNTPAVSLRTLSFMTADRSEIDDFSADQCDKLKNPKEQADSDDVLTRPRSVFPKEKMALLASVESDDDDYAAVILTFPNQRIYLVGCMIYVSQLDEVQHQVPIGFTFKLKAGVDPKKPITAESLDVTERSIVGHGD